MLQHHALSTWLWLAAACRTPSTAAEILMHWCGVHATLHWLHTLNSGTSCSAEYQSILIPPVKLLPHTDTQHPLLLLPLLPLPPLLLLLQCTAPYLNPPGPVPGLYGVYSRERRGPAWSRPTTMKGGRRPAWMSSAAVWATRQLLPDRVAQSPNTFWPSLQYSTGQGWCQPSSLL